MFCNCSLFPSPFLSPSVALSLSLSLSLSLTAASVCRDEEEEDEDGSLVGGASDTNQSVLSGQEALVRMKISTRVIRGPDWKWGDQVSD